MAEMSRRASIGNKKRPQTAALNRQNTGKKGNQNMNNSRLKMSMNKHQ